eukprot:Pompholyxophrys_punicea_v1_NODE_2_length_10808_cov_35.677950.p10 type:complete len:116 gc:universal NODE_2_length_10808_cov_35.677950:8288-8635(+)
MERSSSPPDDSSSTLLRVDSVLLPFFFDFFLMECSPSLSDNGLFTYGSDTIVFPVPPSLLRSVIDNPLGVVSVLSFFTLRCSSLIKSSSPRFLFDGVFDLEAILLRFLAGVTSAP